MISNFQRVLLSLVAVSFIVMQVGCLNPGSTLRANGSIARQLLLKGEMTALDSDDDEVVDMFCGDAEFQDVSEGIRVKTSFMQEVAPIGDEIRFEGEYETKQDKTKTLGQEGCLVISVDCETIMLELYHDMEQVYCAEEDSLELLLSLSKIVQIRKPR